ncbi:MAG: PASTA domain-containing protein [Acidimicrobiia bacterium]
MKSLTRLTLVAAMVGVLFSSLVAPAGAQQADIGYLAAVNGASTDPVLVIAGAEQIADGLEYGADGVGTTVPAGSYDVTFTGGTIVSGVAVDVAGGSAQTVVSGFGENEDTALAYPIDVNPIDAGMAKVTFWNATGATVLVTIGSQASVEVQPGEGLPTEVVAADTPVSVDVDGVMRDIATLADSYTDVFAVNDIQEAQIAISVVASMTDLIAGITPTPPSDVAVPDVVGQSEADANSAITGAGLVPASTEAPDDAVPAGSVVSQDPAAATMVAPDSTVNIVVSTGPDTPATIPIPDVVGQPAEDAQSTLEGEGFTVSVTDQASADVKVGIVISTNPSAGTEVAPGTAVEIVVSSGAEDVVVPDLTGMTTDEATAAAEAAGLTVRIVEDPDNPDPDGVVISQSPAAGSTVPSGSEIAAQLSPDLGEPWSIVTLDPNRLLTVTGVGLLPESTVKLSVVGTDLTESVAVQDDGSWSVRFDLSDVENDTEFLLVVGTAADTSDYEATFKIPAAGQATDQPSEEVVEEDSGFPVWGWLLLGFGVIAIVLLVIRMVTGGSEDESEDADS